MERRLSPRIYEDFPVTVRGVDERGRKFRTETVVDNLSAHGLFVRVGVLLRRGARLLTLVRISPAEERKAPAPLVALKGVITRVVPLADGRFGVGVQFTHHRFL